jgi:hypothetical protein
VISSEIYSFFTGLIHTFLLTLEQKRRRLEFVRTERDHHREWDKILFTDESYVWLGADNRML